MDQLADKTEIIEGPYIFTAGEFVYTYGKLSRFFREIIENKRLFATKCPRHGKVWMPPRGYCPDCYSEMEWIPLSGKGTVVYSSWGIRIPREERFSVACLIHLDGTDTYLYHRVVPKQQHMASIKQGMRVKAAFEEERKGMVEDFYFVPEDDC